VFGGEPGQVFLFLIGSAPTDEGVVYKRILHVDKNSDRRIDAREFFHREDRSEEIRTSAAILLRSFNAHQPQVKTLLDDRRIKLRCLVHVLHARAQFALREFAHAGAKHCLVFGERGEWSARK
jgi:hypothetical protein